MKYTEKYIKSFGKILTNEQLKIVKDSFGYKRCELADELEKIKTTVKSEIKKIFYLGSLTERAKSIKEIIDIRKLVIYSIILSCVFCYAYFKGQGNTPIKVDLMIRFMN
jgi:hypothetical protein